MNRVRDWWYARSELTQLRSIIWILLAAVAAIRIVVGLLAGAHGARFLLTIGVELVGVAITFRLLDRLLRRFVHEEDEEPQHEQLQRVLIAQLGSQTRDIAVQAVEQLKRQGWLIDGTLSGVYLQSANLPEVDLTGANLQRAQLDLANLQEASLSGADLQAARLAGANLHGASLNLANLQGAYLGAANLGSADLIGANLQGVHLGGNQFDADTALPDETTWTPKTDMARFTDPDHPEFWRPERGSVWWYAEG